MHAEGLGAWDGNMDQRGDRVPGEGAPADGAPTQRLHDDPLEAELQFMSDRLTAGVGVGRHIQKLPVPWNDLVDLELYIMTLWERCHCWQTIEARKDTKWMK